ncbi:MAG: phage major capsid protein [Nocardioides sp.]
MNLKEQRAAALSEAQEVVAKAKAENRDLTGDEVAQVEAKTAAVKDLDVKIAAAAKSDELMKQLGSIAPEGDEEDRETTTAKSLGEHFVKSVGADRFLALKAGDVKSVASPEFKAVHTVPGVFADVLTDGVNSAAIQRGYRRPTVADVLGTGSISGNAVTYFVENPTITNAFATVAEAGQKPEFTFPAPTQVTDALKKIAAWWDTSDEMAEDAAFWVSEINNRALYLLSLAEENQLLNGPGTGSTVLGLLNRSGIQTETAADNTDNADALFRAMTKVQTATGLTADALLINPADYQALRLSKDANEQYFGGGFFAGQYGNGGVPFQPPVWGLNTVVTAAVAAGTAVVGALKAATTVYRKGGVRVESTNSDASKFTTNVITTRVEERIALAVRIPAAVVEVTLSDDDPEVAE